MLKRIVLTFCTLLLALPLKAEPFIGEIRLFAGNYAPVGWMACEGQLLYITQYSALFSILGTMYGGNGTSTFALPDLRGRAPIGAGQGTGLTNRVQGQPGGVEQVTLTSSQLPAHTHTLTASNLTATTADPSAALLARTPQNPTNVNGYTTQADQTVTMGSGSIGSTGSGAPVENMQPNLPIRYIICIEGGIYPTRP